MSHMTQIGTKNSKHDSLIIASSFSEYIAISNDWHIADGLSQSGTAPASFLFLFSLYNRDEKHQLSIETKGGGLCYGLKINTMKISLK